MREYRDELRLRALTLRGNTDPTVIENEQQVQLLDAAITTIAGNHLSYQELIVYFYLYSCRKSWDEIWGLYNRSTGGDVFLDAVQRASRRAAGKIRDLVPKSAEFARWDRA